MTSRKGAVRARHDFSLLGASSRRGRAGAVWVRHVPAPEAVTGVRVAYAVNRAAGGAVVRNRIRRRLRAVLAGMELPPGSYLVGAGGSVAHLPHAELHDHLAAAIQMATR